MGGGAWPFLVGGVICLVNSVNERDLDLLNSYWNRVRHNRWVSSSEKPSAVLRQAIPGQLLRGTIGD